MTVLTISSKGWVVIPADLRKKYGLTPGSRVGVVDYGGVLAFVPLLDNPVQQGYGLLKGGSPLTRVLLAEHAQELASEQ